MPQFWAGIVEGKIDTFDADTGWGGWGTEYTRVPALFAKQEDAKRRYQKIAKVEVRIVSKQSRIR